MQLSSALRVTSKPKKSEIKSLSLLVNGAMKSACTTKNNTLATTTRKPIKAVNKDW